ncbi:helix-turn-helix domain-containing protein [Aquicoccus porphyridii]|uniref:Helix-turn-helix domain-containing protein n=2 Tax=Aquicoccus porphyridii TaxID=1852029 RepID=A0A5A9YX59_9RHOB|nr:helix-turn-helix domain-containing protein [Aquicoccus porphyridii]RAI51780.1 AraC family transcriptional regulator [Rhodobacteraceae bacterium AsT-22]
MASIMDTPSRTRRVVVLLFDDVNALDVSGPAQAFDVARLHGRRMYHLRYVSLDGGSVRSSCGLTLGAEGTLGTEGFEGDILVPGGSGVNALLTDQRVLGELRTRLASDGDGRVISVCSGALVLAAAGVLDGRTATTHWSREPDTRRFPRIDWNLDRIAVSGERVFTSAGVTTGIDLALAIIRKDGGHRAALTVARELVVQLWRTGGQSQYAMHLAGQIAGEDAFSRLIETVISEPARRWTLDDMAAEAGMNRRTLTRHFQAHLATSPARFVERIRVDHARGLLEAELPLKRIAREAGFGDLQRMRRAFQRRYGVNVADYLATFGNEAVVR